MEFMLPPNTIPDNARTLYEALTTAKEEAIEICRKQSEILLEDSASFRSEEERIAELERMDRAYDKTRRLIRFLKEKYEDVRVRIFRNPKATAPVFKAYAPDRHNRVPSKISSQSRTNSRCCPRTPANKRTPILVEIASAPKVKGRKPLNKIDLETLRRAMQKVEYIEDPRLKKYRL